MVGQSVYELMRAQARGLDKGDQPGPHASYDDIMAPLAQCGA